MRGSDLMNFDAEGYFAIIILAVPYTVHWILSAPKSVKVKHFGIGYPLPA